MSEETNTETAFPAMTPGGYCTPGMTLRDWFAGQAISGLLAMYGRDELDGVATEQIAEDAYYIASFMLAVRDCDTTTAQQIALGIGGVK